MVPISRKRDRNVLEDDDGIVMNLSTATTGTVNTPKKTAKVSQQQEQYSTPDADTNTSFLGRAFSVATSVFKRRKTFSSSHEKEKHASDSTATAVDNMEDAQLTKLEKQQKPSSPLLHRKAVQLDTSKNETSVSTTKANRLLLSSTGPPSTMIPFQSPILQQAMRTNALEKISQQGSTSSYPLLFSIGRTAPKSLEFSNGRIQPKSEIFLRASSRKMQEHRRKQNESATAIAKRIRESLDEEDLRSLVPPPKPTTSHLKQKFVLGGLESYSSRLPGSHPFAPPAPPPNKHLPQILRPDTRSAPYIEQEPLLLPMESPEAIVQVAPTPRQFPSKEQVEQHLQNLRKSYKPSQKLLMKQLLGDDNEEFYHTQDDDIEVVNQVILDIVHHQDAYGSDHIISLNVDADVLFSVLKQKPTSLSELKPKTTQGDAWWSENSTNNNKFDQLASSSCLPYPLLSFGETASKTDAISAMSKEKDPEVNRSVTTGKWDSHMFPKAGQWRCSNCFSHNDSTKNKCAACDGPIEKKGRTETWGPHMYPKAGQWKCTSCFAHNDSTKIKCAACDTLKEKAATNGILLNNSGGFFFGSPAPTTDANNKGVINVNSSSFATTSNTTEETAPPAKALNIDKSTGSSLRSSTADPLALAVPNNAQQMFGLLPSSGGFKFATSSSGSTTAATNTTENAPSTNFNDSTNARVDTSVVASTFSRPSSDGMLFVRPKDSTAASSAAVDATAPSFTFKFGAPATTPAPNASNTPAALTSTLFGYNGDASAQTNVAAPADSVALKVGYGAAQVSDAPAAATPSSTNIFNNAQSNIETTIGASTSQFRSGIAAVAETPTVPSTASFGGTASINTEVKAAAKTDPTGADSFFKSGGTNSTSTQVPASTSVDGSSLTTAVFGSSNVTAAPPSGGNGSVFSTTAMESSSGDLNFGSTSHKAIPPGSFNFGAASSASTPAKSLAFTFGASTAKPPASAEVGFTFGSANASTSTPALSSSAFSMGGSSATVSSSSATAPPTVSQQPGSFSFGSSSIAAHSTAPGFNFGISSSTSGSGPSPAPAPSGFGAGGTTMGSFGVSTPGPFTFGGSAQNTAGTSFPAVAPTVFSFGSSTSSVPGFATPAQTAPSIPSSSSAFGTTPALQQLGGSGGIPGGGFSLGTGGTSAAKGGRRIVKAKRPNTSR